MTTFLSCLRSLLAIAFIAVSAMSQASAAGWLEKGIYLIGPRYDGTVPACEAALNVIASRFAQKEGRFWNSNLQILGFDRVRETAFRPWAPETVPRRYCSAVAQVSDGRHHTVHYAIIEDGGIIGMFWGVEWCVVGLDRNWAYNPACKMAQP
ncbi:MAG TPA: hypothetical protein VFL53_12320 [Pseudolabrys sp.]|nr:hypothetical protein [Pseudolabrys sp.]